MPHNVKFGKSKLKITLNLDPIINIALGGPIDKLNGLDGREAYHLLWPAVAMIYKPDQQDVYLKLEPEHYGKVDDVKIFFVEMLALCAVKPDAIIVIESNANVPSTTQNPAH